jgi:acetyl esterase/lipase
MHTLRLSLAGMLILALLGGAGGAVVAQDEADDQDVNWPKLTGPLAYDDSPWQVIHVFEPEPRTAPRPAVVFFHGGALVFGEPLQDADWAKMVAEQGYVAFMAGYRLFDDETGENPWPAQLDDAQRAIRWVRAHADEFDVDPERVCAIGHSAGGRLASLLGTTEAADDSDSDLLGIPSRVDCVVSVSGVVDLMVPDPDAFWTSVSNELLGGTVDEVPEVWQAASPTHNVDEDTVPFLVIHGNRDENVPVEMARNLADALAEAGRQFVYAEVPASHMDVRTPQATNALVQTFLDYQLHPER